MVGWFGTWLVALGIYALLPVLTGPRTRRVVGHLAQHFNDWSTSHRPRTAERDGWDDDAEELWQIHRRQRLCADLRRLEHLLVIDESMSATRQLGNRLAYRQLLDELRNTPEVFPRSLQLQTIDAWDEPTVESGWRALSGNDHAGRTRTVEILDIRWNSRRR